MLRLFRGPRADARAALLERVFKRFAGLETRNARRGNLNRRARLRVTPFPSSPLFHGEGTEADQGDLLGCLQAFRDSVEHTIDGPRCSRLRDVSRFRDLFNQFSFIHISPFKVSFEQTDIVFVLTASPALYQCL